MERNAGPNETLPTVVPCYCSLTESLNRMQCCVEKIEFKANQFQSDLYSSGENMNDLFSDFGSVLTGNDRVNSDGNNNKQCRHVEITTEAVEMISRVSNKLLHVWEQLDRTRSSFEEMKSRLIDVDFHSYVSPPNSSDDLNTKGVDVEVPKENSNRPTVGWKERPLILYNNPKRNRFNQTICCVLLTELSTMNHDNLLVHASDTDIDLAACLESNDEQILSCLVTMESKNDTLFNFQAPVHVYLPVLPDLRSNLIPKIKFMLGNSEWKHEDSVQDLILPKQKDVILRGCVVPVSQVRKVTCVAVAIPPLEDIHIDQQGGNVMLRNDRNIHLSFPAKSFKQPTKVKIKTKVFPPCDVKNATAKYLELENVRQASSLITVECSTAPKEDFLVNLHDIDANGILGNGNTEDSLQQHRNWLGQHLDIKRITHQLSNIFVESFIHRLQEEEEHDGKIQLLIGELEISPDTTVDKFIDVLHDTGQTEASEKISIMINSFTENSSDFDPDFEQPVGSVKIVSKTDNYSWRVTPITASDRHGHTVELERGHTSYSLLGLLVRDEMLDSDVCKAAAVLEDVACLTNVSLIVRQNKYNPDKVAIHCIKSSKIKPCLSQLSKKGFTIAPKKSFPEFGLVDGEQIEISFDEFCLEGYERKPFSMTFYSGLDTAKYQGKLCVVHPDRHLSSDRYCSQMTFRVATAKVSLHRSGTISLHLPKPTDELIGYFSYTLDFTVTAMAKHLALKLTSENANSTRWIKCVKHLTTDTIYHHIINQISKELYKPSERQRCEAFLVFWANHYIYPHENKLERMTDVFGPGDSTNKADAQLFIRPFLVSGTLSNEGLRLLAKSLSDKWELMAKKLGLSQSAITEIKNTHDSPIRQSLKMLDVWRLSDSAIMKDTDIVKHLHECAKSAKCSSSVLKNLVRF